MSLSVNILCDHLMLILYLWLVSNFLNGWIINILISGILVLIFWGTTMLFSTVAISYIPFHIPAKNAQDSNFSTSSFWFSIFLRVYILIGVWSHITVVLSHLSLIINDFEYLFTCFIGCLFACSGEMSIQVFCPFLNWVICHLLLRVLYIF